MDIVQFLHVWNAEILAAANVILAIATAVLAIGIPYAIKSASKEEKDSFYATLDETYFNLKRLVIEYPHLGHADMPGRTEDQSVQYDAYAYMIWNFIEAIHDYSRDQKQLEETWHCVMVHEGREHGAWFRNARNQEKFKRRFVEFVAESHLAGKA